MPIQPAADWLAHRPVLAEGLWGTLRHETPTFRYWLNGDKVYIESNEKGDWEMVLIYDGTEIP